MIVVGSAIATCYVLVCTLIITIFVWRVLLRKESWKQLNNAGFPTCIQCGYDLSGQNGDRCTECGAKIAPSLDDKSSKANLAAAITCAAIWMILGAGLGALLGPKIMSYIGL